MESENSKLSFVKRFKFSSSPNKIFIGILVFALVAGLGTGYILASSGSSKDAPIVINTKPKTASQDNKTFRDFAEGTIMKKPEPKKGEVYTEGTHLLKRDNAVPVALTSSVVNLDDFVNKKVKVFGETQKALREGWLMDVGKVEEK